VAFRPPTSHPEDTSPLSFDIEAFSLSNSRCTFFLCDLLFFFSSRMFRHPPVRSLSCFTFQVPRPPRSRLRDPPSRGLPQPPGTKCPSPLFVFARRDFDHIGFSFSGPLCFDPPNRNNFLLESPFFWRNLTPAQIFPLFGCKSPGRRCLTLYAVCDPVFVRRISYKRPDWEVHPRLGFFPTFFS